MSFTTCRSVNPKRKHVYRNRVNKRSTCTTRVKKVDGLERLIRRLEKQWAVERMAAATGCLPCALQTAEFGRIGACLHAP